MIFTRILLPLVMGVAVLNLTGCGGQEQAAPIKQMIKTENTVKIFFWYGCPHCYAVHNEIKKETFKNINFEYVAVPGNEVWTYHAANFYALKRLNKLNELSDKFFDFVQDNHSRTSENMVLDFMEKNGVDREVYKKTLHSDEVRHDLEIAKKTAKQYGVQGVPGIFMDGVHEIKLKGLGSYGDVVTRIHEFYKR